MQSLGNSDPRKLYVSLGLRVYSPREGNRIWLWVYFPIYPKFYLLKGGLDGLIRGAMHSWNWRFKV